MKITYAQMTEFLRVAEPRTGRMKAGGPLSADHRAIHARIEHPEDGRRMVARWHATAAAIRNTTAEIQALTGRIEGALGIESMRELTGAELEAQARALPAAEYNAVVEHLRRIVRLGATLHEISETPVHVDPPRLLPAPGSDQR